MASKLDKTNSYLDTIKSSVAAVLPKDTAENVVLTGAVAAGLLFGPYALAGGLALYAREKLSGQPGEQPAELPPVVQNRKPEPKVKRVVEAILPPNSAVKKAVALPPPAQKPLFKFKPPFHRLGTGLEDYPWSVSSREEYDKLYGNLPEKPLSAKETALKPPAQAAKGGAAKKQQSSQFTLLITPPKELAATHEQTAAPAQKDVVLQPPVSKETVSGSQPTGPSGEQAAKPADQILQPPSAGTAASQEQPSGTADDQTGKPADQILQPLSAGTAASQEQPSGTGDDQAGKPADQILHPPSAGTVASQEQPTGPSEEQAAKPADQILQPSSTGTAASQEQPSGTADDQAGKPADQILQPPPSVTAPGSKTGQEQPNERPIGFQSVDFGNDPLTATVIPPSAKAKALPETGAAKAPSAKADALPQTGTAAPPSAKAMALTNGSAQTAPPSAKPGEAVPQKGSVGSQAAGKPAAPPPPPSPGIPHMPKTENGGNTCYLSAIDWSFIFDDPLMEQRIRGAREELDKLKDFLVADEFQKKAALLDILLALVEKAKKGELITKNEMRSFRGALMNFYPELATEANGISNRFCQKDAESAMLALFQSFIPSKQFLIGVERALEPSAPGIELDDTTTNEEENGWHIPVQFKLDEQGEPLAEVGLKEMVDEFFNENHAAVPPEQRQVAVYKSKGCKDKMPFTVVGVKRQWKGAPPPFLAIVQKRFTQVFDPKTEKMRYVKVQGAIAVPEELEFGPEKYAQGWKTKYRLKAVVNHSGGVWGGHYRAFVKKGGRNHYCDDMAPKSPFLMAKAEEFTIGASTGYILKYVLVEATQPE